MRDGPCLDQADRQQLRPQRRPRLSTGAILQPPALTEEQSARLGEIEARRAELEAEMQDRSISPDAYKALDQEDDRLIAEAEAIEHRAPVLPDELRPHVGAFLLLTPQGEMRLDTNFTASRSSSSKNRRDR